ncbi:hypothetical protein GcM1_241117 [Golovinomyces cichoracearum]|uniref:Uncharacterized protein n=1 Tax=Golovinomyces cichoracearum TaxID=62708 RepID=A0A420IHT5_9PEZI|nr:hypothetical protein GcM1_241117 [Golovinomyces cichoracearum]
MSVEYSNASSGESSLGEISKQPLDQTSSSLKSLMGCYIKIDSNKSKIPGILCPACSKTPKITLTSWKENPVSPLTSCPPSQYTDLFFKKDSKENTNNNPSLGLKLQRNLIAALDFDLSTYSVSDTNKDFSALSLAKPEINLGKIEQKSGLEQLTAKKLQKKRCKSISDSDDAVRVSITRKLSLSEKREFFDIKDQLTLIDLTRAHQCTQQGRLRKASPPKVPPTSLGLTREYAIDNPGMYRVVQWYRKGLLHAEDIEGHRLSSLYPTIVRKRQKETIRRRSQLSLSIQPDEISNTETPASSIRKTHRQGVCDESEAYSIWILKQCEQTNNILFNDSILTKPRLEGKSRYEIQQADEFIADDDQKMSEREKIHENVDNENFDDEYSLANSKKVKSETHVRKKCSFAQNYNSDTGREEIESSHVDDLSRDNVSSSRYLIPIEDNSPFYNIKKFENPGYQLSLANQVKDREDFVTKSNVLRKRDSEVFSEPSRDACQNLNNVASKFLKSRLFYFKNSYMSLQSSLYYDFPESSSRGKGRIHHSHNFIVSYYEHDRLMSSYSSQINSSQPFHDPYQFLNMKEQKTSNFRLFMLVPMQQNVQFQRQNLPRGQVRDQILASYSIDLSRVDTERLHIYFNNQLDIDLYKSSQEGPQDLKDYEMLAIAPHIPQKFLDRDSVRLSRLQDREINHDFE